MMKRGHPDILGTDGRNQKRHKFKVSEVPSRSMPVLKVLI